jgi:ADP-heptose:LPS heptosyltransferase
LPIFIGSPAEKNIIKDLDKTLPQALNLVGKLNFEEVKFLIENCQFLIGNEQGLIHLAIALKKPTVCIIGGGHLGRYSHYGDSNINKWVYDENAKCKFDNWRCALKKNTICAPCIFSITEEMVMREVNNLLKFINEGL